MIRFFRAFAWLRWRLLLNGLKGAKRRDALERLSRLAAILAPALLVIPFGVAAALLTLLGFVGGRRAGNGSSDPEVVLLVARAVLLLVVALPLLVPLGRATHGSSGGIARLLLLPIPRRTLHGVEVVAALADPWLSFVVPGLVLFAAGLLAGGRPAAFLVALFSAIAFLLGVASLSALVSFLADWLMRDRRRGEIFTLVFVLAISVVAILPMVFAEGWEQRVRRAKRELQESAFTVEEFDAELPAWTRAIPSELYARSVQMGLAGLGGRAWLFVLALAAEGAALYGLSSAVHGRWIDSSQSGRSRRRSAEIETKALRVPFLSAAESAVASAQVKNALRSVRGRFAILLPGPMMALLAVLARRMPGEIPGGEVIAVHGYALLGGGCLFSLYALQAFHLNQFASDRAGLTLEFLAPIPDEDLVRGKAVGGAVIYGAAVSLCLISALLVAQGDPTLAWLSVLFGALATYALLSPAAALFSALFPTSADLSKTGTGGNPHGLSVLLGTLLVGVLASPPTLVLVIVHNRLESPGLALALLAAWAVLAVAVAVPLLGRVGRVVARRRENLALVAQGK